MVVMGSNHGRRAEVCRALTKPASTEPPANGTSTNDRWKLAERRLRNILLVLCAIYGTLPKGLTDQTVSCGIMTGCMPAGDGVCGPTSKTLGH